MGRPARTNRGEVMRAAREAFAERGYEGTTLAAIAARVGVSPAALLRHEPTKEALFRAAMAAPTAAGSGFPMAFLAETPGTADPRVVLRRLAETAIPFIDGEMSQSIARWMFSKGAEGLRFPFQQGKPDSPPARVFAMLEGYLRRARAAGRIRVPDTRAAALQFMGGINAYVFFHKVVKLVEPPVPLEVYVDTVLHVWTEGAVRPRKGRS
jgi:AcrR family transcriptional regulator